MRLFVRLKPTGRTRQHMICHDYHFRLQGRANLLHTTDAAHCWQRRTEASLRHRTEGLWTNRCNLPVCTIHTWRRSTTVEPVIYCSDRSKGRQAVDLDHRKFLPSNCNCDYWTTPFPSGARAWTSSRRCFDGRKNDQTGLPAHRSRRATYSVLPSEDRSLMKLRTEPKISPPWRQSTGIWIPLLVFAL